MNTRHSASGTYHPPLHASVHVSSGGGTLHLRDSQHVNMHDASGWTVKALAGSVWITQEGDNRDIALNEGESFTVERNGSTLVSSLGDARICVSHKEERTPPENRPAATDARAPELTGFRLAA